MKTPFKESKFFKVLTSPVVKGILTKVPFGIGSMAGDLLNKNETGAGSMTKEKLLHNIVKIAVYSILLYLAFSGKISMDQAEQAKDFITK